MANVKDIMGTKFESFKTLEKYEKSAKGLGGKRRDPEIVPEAEINETDMKTIVRMTLEKSKVALNRFYTEAGKIENYCGSTPTVTDEEVLQVMYKLTNEVPDLMGYFANMYRQFDTILDATGFQPPKVEKPKVVAAKELNNAIREGDVDKQAEVLKELLKTNPALAAKLGVKMDTPAEAPVVQGSS